MTAIYQLRLYVQITTTTAEGHTPSVDRAGDSVCESRQK